MTPLNCSLTQRIARLHYSFGETPDVARVEQMLNATHPSIQDAVLISHAVRRDAVARLAQSGYASVITALRQLVPPTTRWHQTREARRTRFAVPFRECERGKEGASTYGVFHFFVALRCACVL